MNYLDMILAEAKTPVKEVNGSSKRAAKAAARAKAREISREEKGSSEFAVSYKKTSAIEKKKRLISKLERMVASGCDEDGRQLNPDKIRALKAQLAAEKKAYNDLVEKSSGKAKSKAFSYQSSTDYANSSRRASDGGRASNSSNSEGTKEKIYLEGFYDALDEMGYFDEDYDDYYDEDYDDYDEEDAYLEGYYTALADYGCDY